MMMGFDPYAFNENMTRLSEEIWSIAGSLGHIKEHEGGAPDHQDVSELKSGLASDLRDSLNEMILSIRAALYNLRCDDIAIDLNEIFDRRRRHGDFGETRYHEDAEQDESVDLALLRPYLNAVTNLYDIHIGVQGRRELTSLLRQIPAILDFGKVDVQNEHVVDKALYRFLQLLFNGVIDKPGIPAEVKCYKPDTGVISLRALIEYKYIDSEKKLGEVIDQINADVAAYSTTRDWSWFYIVFYMNDLYSPVADIFSRFANLPYNWKFLIVMPNGEAFEHRSS